MIIIYRKSDGVVVGEHMKNDMAERLAEQYGDGYGFRVIPYEDNKLWLEKSERVQIKARVWHDYTTNVWQRINPDTKMAEEKIGPDSPGPEWILAREKNDVIAQDTPGPGWTMIQDGEYQDRVIRSGMLSINPTGEILIDGVPAPVTTDRECINFEAAAAIRSKYPVGKEFQLQRLMQADPNDPEVIAYREYVAGVLMNSRAEKAALREEV